jgi:hypothetical protein
VQQAKYYIQFAKIKQSYDVIYYNNNAWELKITFEFLKDGIEGFDNFEKDFDKEISIAVIFHNEYYAVIDDSYLFN